MRRVALIIIAAAIAALPLSAQQGANAQETQKPEPKKEAPSIAGKWAMSIEIPDGARQAMLDLKLEGKKVTGSIASDQGETAVTGEFADGKLTFSMTMQGGGGDMQIGFTGVMKPDGTLAGTLEYGQGPINWTAARPKEQ